MILWSPVGVGEANNDQRVNGEFQKALELIFVSDAERDAEGFGAFGAFGAFEVFEDMFGMSHVVF